MAKKLNISYDSDLIESISDDFDLRTPNKEALRKLIFTLDGDYDTNVMQVLNLATGERDIFVTGGRNLGFTRVSEAWS